MRAGEPIKIDIPIVGSPTPTVTWSKDGKDVPNGPKVSNSVKTTTVDSIPYRMVDSTNKSVRFIISFYYLIK